MIYNEIKTKVEPEHINIKDFKDLTVTQTHMSSSTFRMFNNFNYINFNGYDYVDLGLPSGTLWATRNLGALNPEDVGNEFHWGASTPDCTSPYNSRTARVLPLEHDTANINMGGDWHIPQPKQCDELIDYTTQEKITINGKLVAKFTSTINGNYIILPIADYWSNTVVSHYDGDEMIDVMEVFTYGQTEVQMYDDYQCYNSCNVRAVIDAPPIHILIPQVAK